MKIKILIAATFALIRSVSSCMSMHFTALSKCSGGVGGNSGGCDDGGCGGGNGTVMATMVTAMAAVVAMATTMAAATAATTAWWWRQDNGGNSNGKGAQTTINYKGLGRKQRRQHLSTSGGGRWTSPRKSLQTRWTCCEGSALGKGSKMHTHTG